MRFILILCANLAMTTAVAAKSVSKPKKVTRHFSSVDMKFPCQAEVLNILGKLEMPVRWTEISQSEGRSDLRVLVTKTTSPSVELELGFDQQNVLITRRSAQLVVQYKLTQAKNCEIELTTMRGKNDSPHSFTDEDLAELIQMSQNSSTPIVLYTWSPSMTLSIKGVKEIYELSKSQKFKLVVLRDPMSRDSQAKQIAVRNLWPEAFTKKLESKELLRDLALIHFPTLFTIHNGKVSPVRPGYDTPETIKSIIKSAGEQ